MALLFPVEAGRLLLLLNCQRPFEYIAKLLLQSNYGRDAVSSTVVLLLQGGLLQSDCQQLQALYYLSTVSNVSPIGRAMLVQAAGCEAVSLVVRALALCLLAEGGSAIGRFTPQEFMQTLDPGCVLSAPTLLELQLQWLDGLAQLGSVAVNWLPDASAIRATVLPPAEAAALRELGLWAEISSLQDSNRTGVAYHAAEVLRLLQDLAKVLDRPLEPPSASSSAVAKLFPPPPPPQQEQQPNIENEGLADIAGSGDEPSFSFLATRGEHQVEQEGECAECRSAAGEVVQPHPTLGSAEAAGSMQSFDVGVAAADSALSPRGEHDQIASSGSVATQDFAGLNQLLSQAQRFPLLPGDQRELLAGLKGSAAAVVACRADLNQYRGLIENNPLVAAWLLISINWHAQRAVGAAGAAAQVYLDDLEFLSKSIPNYLAVLCTLPMTNHSMECMTTLVDSAPPPPTVLAVFVANCIRTIDSTQEGSRQARLAKLLCAFLQHLIDRGQEGVVPAIFADVQSFCIAWSRLKEAAALFKQLKELEGLEEGNEELEGSSSGR